MKHAFRILMASVAVSTALSPLPPGTPSASELSVARPASAQGRVGAAAHPRDADYPLAFTTGRVTVYAADATRLAQAKQALELFAAADLELPPLTVWMHRDLHGCSAEPGRLGRAGVTVHTAESVVVHSCGTKFTLLHELAHAHVAAFVDDHRRTAFMATRNATAWRDEEWHLSGAEHAADVIAWRLLDGAVRPSRTLPNDDASLAEGFALLTAGG